MKERLKAAGVNRIIAGINDEEEYEYGSEDEEPTEAEQPKEQQAAP